MDEPKIEREESEPTIWIDEKPTSGLLEEYCP